MAVTTHGPHDLTFTRPSAAEDERNVDVSGDVYVNVCMFQRRPDALQLRPTYPGGGISSAVFLDDGRLALTMAVRSQAGHAGSGVLNEAWIFDFGRGADKAYSCRPHRVPDRQAAIRHG